MRLRQLEILTSVVRHQSFSGAAAELGLTQPAVSMQMKSLAAEVGIALFVPRGRGLEATPAAHVLARYADRILRLAEDAKTAARLGSPGASVVRVAASSTPGAVLPERIAAYERVAPDVAIRLQVHNSRSVEAQVASGEVDVGVIGGTRSIARLRVEHWCDDELVVIVAPDHRLAKRRQVRAAELANERVLTREAGSATRTAWEAAFQRANLAMPETHVLGDPEALKHAVTAGLGVACVSPLCIRAEVAAGRLRALRVRGLDLRRPLSILLHDEGAAVPATDFVAYLRRNAPSGN